jgi:3-oxo-5alpha-steroid 4-dehydrogenase
MILKEPTGCWDAEADIVIVGFGGAGASAALEAAQRGASVLVLERFHGGGATAISGGVIYAGGGTPYQEAAGYEDTVEDMFNYLREEVSDAMGDQTLHRFCEGSREDLRWLAEAGVPFGSTLCPFKTSYPTNNYCLYFSGSENNGIYKAKAKPAPRGHRVKGKGLTGPVLFRAIAREIKKHSNIKVRCQTHVLKLLQDDDGGVIGVEGLSIPANSILRPLHSGFTRMSAKVNTYLPPLGQLFNSIANVIFRVSARPYRARARKGVILAAGGFIFNRKMVRKYNRAYLRCMPLGTYGDDGSGIALGESVGGATSHMDRMSAWRFYVPPEALIQGILVNQEGQRICSEDLYGGRQGDYIVSRGGGKAYLIFDSKTYNKAKAELWSQCTLFQKLTMIPMLLLNRKKASSLEKLAFKIGVRYDGLLKTVNEYNETARTGKPDPLGKAHEYFVPQDTPPFYALDCSLYGISLLRFGLPAAAITLGGLVVDEETGQVKRKDGSVIKGLYAAGRNAVGLCSDSYFASGSSIADCIFSGRRAARHASSLPYHQ